MSDSSSSAPKADTAASVSQPAAPTPTTTSTVVPASTPSTTPATTAPVSTTTAVTEPKAALVSPLREDLIKPAVSFLSSPNVRSADKAKKIAFLQKKGLNQAEIDEAFKRSGGDDAPTTTATTTTTTVATTPANNYTPQNTSQPALAPVLPSRNAINYGPPQVIYLPEPPAPSIPAEKVFAMAVLLGMSAVGLTAGVVGLLRRFIAPIFNRIAEYQRNRYIEHKEVADKLAKSIKKFNTENDDLDALIDQGEEATVSDALVKQQTELSSKIDKLIAASRERVSSVLKQKTYTDFRSELTSFRNVVTAESPFNSYSSYSPHYNRHHNDSPAVSGLKSDIRSLKAVLLNRRNFPTAR